MSVTHMKVLSVFSDHSHQS